MEYAKLCMSMRLGDHRYSAMSDRRWGGQPAHSERADGWLYLSFAELLLTGSREGACGYVDADVRDAEAMLEQAARTLDSTKPVAVLLLAILHLIPDADAPAAIVARLANGLVPGSYVAISHMTADFAPDQVTAATNAYNALAPIPVTARTHTEVTALFGSLPLVAPGVVPITEWRPNAPVQPAQPADLYAGLARTAARGARVGAPTGRACRLATACPR
jgi:hypothetical protein